MFDLDLSKFAFFGSTETIERKKSSNLPRPRLSKNNVKLHNSEVEEERFSYPEEEPKVFHFEVETASIKSDCEEEGQNNGDIDDDYYYDYAECDSGHQSGCGSINLRNSDGLVVPAGNRFRSVSFNDDNEDEDGYSYVSNNHSSTPVDGSKSQRGQTTTDTGNNKNNMNGVNLLEIVGSGKETQGPFGKRKCVYLDEGRAVVGIENFIGENVLPFYSAYSSNTNSKLMELREEARQIIHKSCGGCEEDKVIFCDGREGSWSSIPTLLNLLVKPETSSIAPIVILGPFQSSSGISVWEKLAHEVINIPLNTDGTLDSQRLERTLKAVKSKKAFKSRLVIGVFSACSNVTGMIRSDDVTVTSLLHKYGAYSVWDYETAGPHVEIEMNPKTGDATMDKLARKDAIFFSGRNFLGGTQTPDVVIAKKSMFRNQDRIIAENGIIGEIKLGLVFELKNSVGCSTIIDKESDFTSQVLTAWGNVPEIVILGDLSSIPRVPIVSFMIKHPETGYFLHHEFVVTLLRDLFGIQSCIGSISESPYAQALLGIDDKLVKKYSGQQHDQLLEPGFTKVILPHTVTQKEISFTIEAIKLLANEGWKLLPFYDMNQENGTFKYSGNMDLNKTATSSIKSFSMNTFMQHIENDNSTSIIPEYRYNEYLTYAKDLIESIEMITQHNEITHDDLSTTNSFRNESLRWFLTPSDALTCIKHPYNMTKHFGLSKKRKCFIVPNNNNKLNKISFNWTRGSLPYNYAKQMRIIKNSAKDKQPPIIPPPRQSLVKSSSLKSLDFEMGKKGERKCIGPFSRREFQSLLNENYFGTSLP